MTLSAYLAESTGDDKFKEKALLTANCIKSHIIDAETNLVKDCIINGLTCETESSTLSCHLTGMFLRGLAILATITDDTTWTTLLLEVAKASMQYPDWHDNGILIAGIEGEASENNDQKCLRGCHSCAVDLCHG
ncbi:hypothetical protein FRC03_008450 [Tulasnella sp. 419]|nr:hypothetical protein FRC03_008450 [Tulasnella sp. 419]